MTINIAAQSQAERTQATLRFGLILSNPLILGHQLWRGISSENLNGHI